MGGRIATSLAALALVSASSGTARAQDKDLVPDEVKPADTATVGWDGFANMGATINIAHSSNVIGQTAGTSWTLGATARGGSTYKADGHELKATLDLLETFTRSPNIDEFVKSADTLAIEGLYRYSWAPWFGPFGRASGETSIFAGQVVRERPVTFVGGAGLPVTADRLDLTNPFEPLTLKQSAGVFIRPVDSKQVKIDIRAGVGGREVLAEGARAVVAEDTAAGTITIADLTDVIQAGGEAAAVIEGELEEGKVSYRLSAEALVPLINNAADTDDRNAAELTNIDIAARLSFKLVSWASVDYQLRALRVPQLLDEFQVQNNLLLTIAYTLLEAKK